MSAVTYAVRDVAPKVPAGYLRARGLSLAQLKAIFLCTATTWGQVGGTKGQPIKAYLPQTGSGTLSFWLKALGITAAGSCVNESLEENQGLSAQFNSPNAIFIYSVGDWIAQKYHSPLPGHKPRRRARNVFGTDQVGFLGIDKIDGIAPITSAKVPAINKGFKVTGFTRTLYDIVRYQAAGNHIPANLNRILSRTGYFCHNTTATKAIESYGFTAGRPRDLRLRFLTRTVASAKRPSSAKPCRVGQGLQHARSAPIGNRGLTSTNPLFSDIYTDLLGNFTAAFAFRSSSVHWEDPRLSRLPDKQEVTCTS